MVPLSFGTVTVTNTGFGVSIAVGVLDVEFVTTGANIDADKGQLSEVLLVHVGLDESEVGAGAELTIIVVTS